ncbi:hypothetical protein [Paractinoplanes brasiliensis]|uniref:Uncharacterized protein n=1 Tax=Paractinoplanes brasiliensis TaxID=52695 RepID=A0A4R6K0B2_9ACTN|nr:hypothetical protein [Actinoplanes brasiliensis]TDO41481.1 hypothetical protein C8E87_5214 [Actinoplanes brasiliensis]GID27235.1 hypothetical protein Abr02nite_22180 [Actinoplanes brasiliensis]
MFGRPGNALPELCTGLADAVIRLDSRASTKSYRAIVDRLPHADQEELSAALVPLAPALEQVALGNGALLATLVAGLIEQGADPLPVLPVLVERLATGLELAAQFGVLADKLGDGVAAPTSADEYTELRERVVRASAGLTVQEAGEITQAWFTVKEWIPSLLLPLQQKRARQALPQRERLTAATSGMTPHAEDAAWLYGLLEVLDDEPLLVLHRPTKQAYDLTISGVGDNFQLHTLLAATLIGAPARGLLPGTPPDPAWVAAATEGELSPPDPIHGQFYLADATGETIWHEGRPADIPLLGDHRVVVLDPPPYERSWNIGRTYPLMRPEVTLNRTLPASEAFEWAARVAPAS